MTKKVHFKFYVLLILTVFCSLVIEAQDNIWTKINANNRLLLNPSFERLGNGHHQTFKLDLEALKQQLKSAPLRGSSATTRAKISISFPNAHGEFERFTVFEAPVLSEELSARYPNIKTYVGFGEHGKRIRFSVTSQGLIAMTSTHDYHMAFIQPVSKRSAYYTAYLRDDFRQKNEQFVCDTEDKINRIQNSSSKTNRTADDQTLRTFRIAISGSAEYTNTWDDGDETNGDVREDALAQVVSTLNRTNEIFEVDMAVTFTLVSGVSILYTDATTDPYGTNLNGELQSTLTAEIGEDNYDIGHLFHRADPNGNAGCIGCVCVDGQKGSGQSTAISPIINPLTSLM